MNITIIGATGNAGSRIVTEALHRGHKVRAIVRQESRNKVEARPDLTIETGDILDAQGLASVMEPGGCVVSAYGPPADQVEKLMDATRSLLAACKAAQVKRLIVVGGAGSLYVDSNTQLVDTPNFPAAVKPVAMAHRDTLKMLKQEDELNWTYISPSAMFGPGERTGVYRRGTDQLLVDKDGNSSISMEDYAIALLDEIEQPKVSKARITVGY
ncbi:MAG: NAD(P)-dependent oxidoreductase [Desulfobacteraceae bacterium]